MCSECCHCGRYHLQAELVPGAGPLDVEPVSKFYEQEDLKGIRETLDSELPTSREIQKLVEEQDAKFTDYLNFFEFMAYLNQCDQLSQADIRALFHYYLRAMWKHEAVRKYVLDDENGYDYLKTLLPKLTL